jgi:hypothetical protein
MKRLSLILLAGGAVAAAVARVLQRRGGDAPDPHAEEQRWTCACGAEYRVSGTGRHRVFWPADGGAADVVMGSDCPSCGRPLPR